MLSAPHAGRSTENGDLLQELLVKGESADDGVPLDDVDGLFEKLRASGAEVLQEPMDQGWGPRDCAFRDPSGDMVRIARRLPPDGEGVGLRQNGPADTPGSVRCRSTVTAIYLGTTLPQPSSGLPGNSASSLNVPCLTLLRTRFTQRARSLGPLVVSYTTVSPLPPARRTEAVCSLLHFLADCSGWVLPTALLCGARTFLGTPPKDE